jgi:hypothetical protein
MTAFGIAVASDPISKGFDQGNAGGELMLVVPLPMFRQIRRR